MNNDSDKSVLALGDLMRGGKSYAVNNAGKIIATITLIVATVTTFANVTLASLGGEAFTVTLIVMLISSYLMYFSLEDAGEKEGSESAEYKEANEKFLAVREKVSSENIDELKEFCLDYSAKELIYRRKNYLCEHGLSISDLDAFNNGADFPARVSRHLRKANRMRAVKLTAARVLSRSHTSPLSELAPPESGKILSTALTLVPSTICTVFTVSIILTAKDGLSPSTVIDGIIKLSALPTVGLKGFLDGYKYARDAKLSWLETKTRLLEKFLSS